jgi:hypothetical protein
MRRLALLPLLTFALACNDGAIVQPDTNLQPGQDAPGIAASSHSNGVVASVTGSGHFTTAPPAFNPGLWRTFALTARKYADGSVKGSFNRITHFADGGVEHERGRITCFTIVGNTAWIGGMVPGETPPDVAWQVVDNGQGAAADPDQNGLQLAAATFGWPAGFAQEFCNTTPTELDFGSFGGVLPLSLVLFDIEAGNIQIR